MSSPRRKVMEAVSCDDLDPLTEIFLEQLSRNPSVTLAEVVAELDRKQRDGFWSKTVVVVDRAIEGLETHSKRYKDLLVSVTNLIVSVVKGKKIPVDGILPLVLKIHDTFDTFADDVLKNRCSLMCELWWSQKLDNREEITQNTFAYLLRRATGSKGNKTDIHRAYAMRKCITLMERDDDLFRLIVTSSLFLSTDEGRKMVALVVTSSEVHVTTFLEPIKIKLSECGGAVAQRYGDIFLHAWVIAPNDGTREKLEEECIQLFMHHCIHASRRPFAATLQKLLLPFHSRDNPEVQAMLHRLYQPILWRALKATNPIVRCNAASLLFASFPLEDPGANVVDKNEDMQRKLNLIEELLFDPAPDVREVTVLGVSKICSTYWELIPKSVIKTLLSYLVEEFAFDVSSKKVRLAVMRGFTILLDNPLSHPFLKTILHKLGTCLYDSAESVRVRFLDLLLSIKSLRTIKFWDVVEPDDLLDGLSMDTEPVRRRIVRLLLNSYHPLSRTDDVLISRCVNLLLAHRIAARNFYSLLHHYVDLQGIVHFILLVIRVLHLHVRSKNRKAVTDGEAEDPYFVDPYASPEESDTGDNKEETELDDEAITALMDVVCILWVSVRGQLAQEQNAKLKKELNVKCAKSMMKLFRFFKGSDAFKSLLYLSSLLPASLVSTPVGHCLSKLRSFDASSTEVTFGCFVEAACRWGRGEDIMELISDWLRAGLSLGDTKSTCKKKNKGKSVRFKDVHEPQPLLALRFLDSIMERPECRTIVLRHKSNRESLNGLLLGLECVLKIVGMALEKKPLDNENATVEFLSLAFQSYCKLIIVLHSDTISEEDPVSSIPELIEWVESTVVPRLIEADEVENVDTINRGEDRGRNSRKRSRRKPDKAAVCDPTLAWSVVQSTATVLVNLLPLPNLDMDLVSLIANFFASILTLGIPNKNREGSSLLLDTVVCLYRLQECSLTVFRGQGSVILETTIPSLFADVVVAMSKFCTTYAEDASTMLLSVRPALRDLLSTYGRCSESSHRQALHAVVASIVNLILRDVTSQLSEVLEDANDQSDVNDPEDESDELNANLPVQSIFWIKMLAGNRICLRLFTTELLSCLKPGAPNLVRNLLSSLVIYSALGKEKLSAADLKDGILGIQEIVQLVSREPQSSEETITDLYLKKSNLALQKLKTLLNLV